MQLINFTEQMFEASNEVLETAILEDTYYHYDSELIAEDLSSHEIKKYLESRPDIVRGGCGSYTNDKDGIATLMIAQNEKIYRRVIMTKGFVIIRNRSGSYDIHEFWRQ